MTPLPVAVTSCQPTRSMYDRSLKAIAVPAASGAGSAAVYVQTRRIVSSPAAPGGKPSPAATARSGNARPPALSESSGASLGQAATRSASASSSDTIPSASVSIRSFSWKVGISA